MLSRSCTIFKHFSSHPPFNSDPYPQTKGPKCFTPHTYYKVTDAYLHLIHHCLRGVIPYQMSTNPIVPISIALLINYRTHHCVLGFHGDWWRIRLHSPLWSSYVRYLRQKWYFYTTSKIQWMRQAKHQEEADIYPNWYYSVNIGKSFSIITGLVLFYCLKEREWTRLQGDAVI